MCAPLEPHIQKTAKLTQRTRIGALLETELGQAHAFKLRVGKLRRLKNLQPPMTSALKATIGSVILIVAVILALAVPWYPVTTSQQVPQLQAYTTNITGSFATTSTGTAVGNLTQINYYLPLGQPQTVYALPSPVTFSSQYANWTSSSFHLQSGMAFRLTVSLCEDCFIAMMPQNGTVKESLTYDFNTNPPQLGMNNYTVIGLVANSGNYVIFMHNSELAGTVTSLSVSEMTASLQTSTVTSQAMQVSTVLATVTSTAYSTSNSTAYTQSMNPPYTVLGLGASAAIILVVAIIAVFSILRDRDLISTSSKHRRKRA